jgi:prolyl 4-hydroxylase
MSDVLKGGATVFPYLKVHVPASKGSAIFWYNLKPSGVGELVSRHAGCPVLTGSKWIGNKWIHEFDQNLKCATENDEELDPTDFFKRFF